MNEYYEIEVSKITVVQPETENTYAKRDSTVIYKQIVSSIDLVSIIDAVNAKRG